MINTLIFGGTTEGRQALLREPDAVVCVTSDYARSLLPPGTDCRVGALNREEMLALMLSLRPRRVIDATHPYAVQVQANIRFCCGKLGIPLTRIERPADEQDDWRKQVRTVRDAREAAEVLAETEGPIYLTTGSHTLSVYTQIIPPERLYVRVLPSMESLRLCQEAGILPSHICAMQGPFSLNLNLALFEELHIRTMVTKDSGAAGGLTEKVRAALALNIDIILIERPKSDNSDMKDSCGEQNAR